MKNVRGELQCWRRTGHSPSFFVPTQGDLKAQESQPPVICHPRQKKKNANGGRWNWLMHKLLLSTQTKRSVTTVVHTNIQENQISWRRINFITWKFGLYSTTNCRHKQRQPSRMSHLTYFRREPKTIIQAENINNRRKSVSNKYLSQFRIQWTSQYYFVYPNITMNCS